MTSEIAVSNSKTELDDSGCVQDADSLQNGIFQTSLLDMPDDVLLYILQNLKARDLKALGYCSRRLCRLVQEKSLWRHVDARDDKCSRLRLKWYLDNVLRKDTVVLLLSGFSKDVETRLRLKWYLDNASRKDTVVLLLSGFSKDVETCLGFMNLSREEGERVKNSETNWEHVEHFALQLSSVSNAVQCPRKVCSPNDYWFRRCSGLPSWANSDVGKKGPQACTGPQFSLSHDLLRDLCNTCPKLHTLALEYCNIDCRTTNLGQFPKSLKKLSLRGSKCYNMVVDKTFLFRINTYLPDLESLDVSECEWMDPATLLPLSKLASLRELSAQKCVKMTEFVAYASLTARYGFKSLKSLDLRGSPVGDSEVSALGWLPSLEKLWLAASKNVAKGDPAHAHFIDDPATTHVQLHDWEMKEQRLYNEKPENIYYYYDVEDLELREKDGLKRKCDGETESGGDVSIKRQKLNDNNDEVNDRETNNNDDETQEHNDVINDSNKSELPSTSKSEGNESGESSSKANVGSSSSSSASSASSDKNGEDKNKGETGHKRVIDNIRERSVVDCIKIDGLLNCGDILRCDDHGEVIVFASRKCSRVQTPESNGNGNNTGGHVRFRRGENPVIIHPNDSERDSDRKPNLKRSHDVNEGASTSRQPETGEPKPKTDKVEPKPVPNRNRNEENERVNEPIDYRIEPRHHVLYVNVGPQVNTYRFPREFSTPDFHENRGLNMQRRHVDASSLVTDFAIRRFGRADGEDVNIIHIGPNGPVVFGQDMASRPDRSNLRYLSVNGYRNITDRSLVHLATAAPNLTEIDFSDTNVTETGAENFRGLRPDCKLVYSKFAESGE